MNNTQMLLIINKPIELLDDIIFRLSKHESYLYSKERWKIIIIFNKIEIINRIHNAHEHIAIEFYDGHFVMQFQWQILFSWSDSYEWTYDRLEINYLEYDEFYQKYMYIGMGKNTFKLFYRLNSCQLICNNNFTLQNTFEQAKWGM